MSNLYLYYLLDKSGYLWEKSWDAKFGLGGGDGEGGRGWFDSRAKWAHTFYLQ